MVEEIVIMILPLVIVVVFIAIPVRAFLILNSYCQAWLKKHPIKNKERTQKEEAPPSPPAIDSEEELRQDLLFILEFTIGASIFVYRWVRRHLDQLLMKSTYWLYLNIWPNSKLLYGWKRLDHPAHAPAKELIDWVVDTSCEIEAPLIICNQIDENWNYTQVDFCRYGRWLRKYTYKSLTQELTKRADNPNFQFYLGKRPGGKTIRCFNLTENV